MKTKQRATCKPILDGLRTPNEVQFVRGTIAGLNVGLSLDEAAARGVRKVYRRLRNDEAIEHQARLLLALDHIRRALRLGGVTLPRPKLWITEYFRKKNETHPHVFLKVGLLDPVVRRINAGEDRATVIRDELRKRYGDPSRRQRSRAERRELQFLWDNGLASFVAELLKDESRPRG